MTFQCPVCGRKKNDRCQGFSHIDGSKEFTSIWCSSQHLGLVSYRVLALPVSLPQTFPTSQINHHSVEIKTNDICGSHRMLWWPRRCSCHNCSDVSNDRAQKSKKIPEMSSQEEASYRKPSHSSRLSQHASSWHTTPALQATASYRENMYSQANKHTETVHAANCWVCPYWTLKCESSKQVL